MCRSAVQIRTEYRKCRARGAELENTGSCRAPAASPTPKIAVSRKKVKSCRHGTVVLKITQFKSGDAMVLFCSNLCGISKLCSGIKNVQSDM